MAHTKWLLRNGLVGEAGKLWGKSTHDPPRCAACQLGKQQRLPTPGKKTVSTRTEGALKRDKLEPGDLIFSDQYESRLEGKVFGHRGRSISSQGYCGGTLFCDAASSFIQITNQVSLSGSETVAAKLKFEREAAAVGVSIKQYQTDNGVYTSKAFMESLDAHHQTIKHSGVGGHQLARVLRK
jgi:hypothetical protein